MYVCVCALWIYVSRKQYCLQCKRLLLQNLLLPLEIPKHWIKLLSMGDLLTIIISNSNNTNKMQIRQQCTRIRIFLALVRNVASVIATLDRLPPSKLFACHFFCLLTTHSLQKCCCVYVAYTMASCCVVLCCVTLLFLPFAYTCLFCIFLMLFSHSACIFSCCWPFAVRPAFTQCHQGSITLAPADICKSKRARQCVLSARPPVIRRRTLLGVVRIIFCPTVRFE